MKFDFQDLVEDEDNRSEAKYKDNDKFLKRKRNRIMKVCINSI